MYFRFRAVDTLISTIDRSYSDMNVTISRPFATNAVLQVFNVLVLEIK